MSLRDQRVQRSILDRQRMFGGRIWDVMRESFLLSDSQQPLTRDFIEHPGAVAVVALDEQHRVLLLRQYRHPVRSMLWELPAGLLDIAGEDYHAAAARELAEEADLRAEDWRVLVDLYNSPGSSSEALRIYLATGLHEVPEAERHQRTEEESEIVLDWQPLEAAVAAVLSGRIHNGTTIAGILALAAVQQHGGPESLRPADAPWPEHAQITARPVETEPARTDTEW